MKTSRFGEILLKRPENMGFSIYKRIRKDQNEAIRKYLKGIMIHVNERRKPIKVPYHGNGDTVKLIRHGNSGIIDLKPTQKSILMALLTTKAFWIMLAIIILSIILIAVL